MNIFGGRDMRGIHSVVDELRKSVFKEVAQLAYEGGDYSRIDRLPYKIVPGDVAKYPSGCAWPAACPCARPMSTAQPATALRRPPYRRSIMNRPW